MRTWVAGDYGTHYGYGEVIGAYDIVVEDSYYHDICWCGPQSGGGICTNAYREEHPEIRWGPHYWQASPGPDTGFRNDEVGATWIEHDEDVVFREIFHTEMCWD